MTTPTTPADTIRATVLLHRVWATVRKLALREDGMPDYEQLFNANYSIEQGRVVSAYQIEAIKLRGVHTFIDIVHAVHVHLHVLPPGESFESECCHLSLTDHSGRELAHAAFDLESGEPVELAHVTVPLHFVLDQVSKAPRTFPQVIQC